MLQSILANVSEKGKLQLTEKEKSLINRIIAQFAGKTIELEFKVYANTRTTKQNRLYWYMLQVITNEFNNLGNNLTSYDTHLYFKDMFLDKRKIVLNDSVKYLVPSTTQLNKSEFEAYLQNIKNFCLDNLNLVL